MIEKGGSFSYCERFDTPNQYVALIAAGMGWQA